MQGLPSGDPCSAPVILILQIYTLRDSRNEVVDQQEHVAKKEAVQTTPKSHYL